MTTVLIVDDDAHLAVSMAGLLELVGHKVVLAATLTSAIDSARSYRPECVLCDWDLGPSEPTGADLVGILRVIARPSTRFAIWSGVERKGIPDGVSFFLKDGDGMESVMAWVAP